MTNQEQQAAVREEARKFVIENCLARNPVVVLGSGASVKYGLPTMGQLKDAIVDAVDPMKKTDPAKAAWEEFKGILRSRPMPWCRSWGVYLVSGLSGRDVHAATVGSMRAVSSPSAAMDSSVM